MGDEFGDLDLASAQFEQRGCAHGDPGGLALVQWHSAKTFVVVWRHWLFRLSRQLSLSLCLEFVFHFMQEYQQQRITNFVLPDENATFGEKYNVEQALIAIGSGGLVRARVWSRHANPIALSESAPYGLYLFCHLRRIRAGWLAAGDCYYRAGHLEMPAYRAEGAGCGWDEYCLWGRNLDFLPGYGQYQYELEYCAGFGIASAFHQLWRQRSDSFDAGHWVGGKCCHAAQATGILMILFTWQFNC